MQLHLVGGFLGSGKTTAIIGAAQLLMAQGKRVGVVTNDQGRYLVDTALFASSLPTVEVTGGCFCCNYDNLQARLDQLQASAQPDVIFAESVGSCADLVATVVRPLLGISKYLLGWFVDTALLGGGAWLLGGTATFAGALLQRWQSGNLRSYAAWLAAGTAAVLLFVVVPWATVWPASLNFIWKMAGH